SAALPAVRHGGDRCGVGSPRALAAVGSGADGINAEAAGRRTGAHRAAGRRGAGWAPNVRRGSWLASMYGYGVSYAIASLSCTVGPFLAVTGAGLRRGSVIGDASIYLAYIAGLILVVGVLAVAAAAASTAVVNRLRRILPYVNRISGA